MIVETQLLGHTDVELVAPDVARELRAALGVHELLIRRVIVRLRLEPGRHFCRIRALLREGVCLVVQKRSRTIDEAVSDGIDALVRAVALRPAPLARAQDGPRSAGAARPLLFALPALGYPSGSLKSAGQLALRTGMTLHVVRVLPAARLRGEYSGVNPLAGPTREAARRLQACRETRAWCDQVLPRPLPALHVRVRAGEFVSVIAQRAQELDAELISVPAMRGRSGSLVAALARSSGVPVLVTRGRGTVRSLLAASDLEDESYPILRKAAELAGEVAADVLLLHDLAERGRGPHRAPLAVVTSAGQRSEQQRQRLLRAAHRWLPRGKIVVTRENDPARAIVAQAVDSDVDTIVVGTRPRPWLARGMAQTVAARVVESADRSVLVVPIDGGEAGPAPAVSTGLVG